MVQEKSTGKYRPADKSTLVGKRKERDLQDSIQKKHSDPNSGRVLEDGVDLDLTRE